MNVEKWIDELQIAVADLARKIRDAAASAFAPDITTPSDGQIIIYDATEEAWKNADLPPSGTKITASSVIGYFPADANAGDVHYLVDGNGRENAKYRYSGEAWTQLSGFNYMVSDTEKATIMSGYGLYDTIGYESREDFYYVIGELGYKLKSGGGNFTSLFWITEPIIFDLDKFSGFQITGKFRGAAFDETVTFEGNITSGYCGCLCICYNTDNAGNWLSWQVCRPFIIETGNNALPQGTIVEKQSGQSGDLYITGLKLLKVQPVTNTRKKTTKKEVTK